MLCDKRKVTSLLYFADILIGNDINTSKFLIIVIGISSVILVMQVWHIADVPPNDKFQYTHFAHKLNSFDTAPRKLLASDSRLRPDRYALEMGDLSKSGTEKSRFISFVPFLSPCAQKYIFEHCLSDVYKIL